MSTTHAAKPKVILPNENISALFLAESQVLATFCFWIFTIKCFCLSPVNQLLDQLLLPVVFLTKPYLSFASLCSSCFTIYCYLCIHISQPLQPFVLVKSEKGMLQRRQFFCLRMFILLRMKAKLCQILYRC